MTYERLPFPKVVLQPIPLTIYQGRFRTSLKLLRQMRGCGDNSMNAGLRYEDNRVPICLYHEDDIEQKKTMSHWKTKKLFKITTLWKEFRKTRSKSTGEQLQLTPDFVEELRRNGYNFSKWCSQMIRLIYMLIGWMVGAFLLFQYGGIFATPQNLSSNWRVISPMLEELSGEPQIGLGVHIADGGLRITKHLLYPSDTLVAKTTEEVQKIDIKLSPQSGTTCLLGNTSKILYLWSQHFSIQTHPMTMELLFKTMKSTCTILTVLYT